MRVSPLEPSECHPWVSSDEVIARPDNRFFSLAKSGNGYWIIQPEIGLLGSILRRTASGVEILIQHKKEPGNLPLSQIAPTVQATQSNIERVHGGKPQPYLDFFSDEKLGGMYPGALNSEQGLRFWKKRNLNKTVFLENEIHLVEDFEWLAFDTFASLLLSDFQVNTDLRSVISSSDWNSLVTPNSLNMEIDDSSDFFQAQKKLQSNAFRLKHSSSANVSVSSSTEESPEWKSYSPKECQVGFYHIEEAEREVTSWRQPLIVDRSQDEFNLVLMSDGEKDLALLSIVEEPGLWNWAEWSVTWSDSTRGDLPEEIASLVSAQPSIIESILQTDEGGRFFQVKSRYSLRILRMGKHELAEMRLLVDANPNHVLVDLVSLNRLCSRSLTTTNELRTLASMVLAKMLNGELR